MKKIGRYNRKRCSIRINADLYEVFLSYIIHCLLFYFMTIITPLFYAIFVVSISLGERSSEIIVQYNSSIKRTNINIIGGGKMC